MNSKLLVFAALAALLLPCAFAVISSQRAVDFVTKENYYLYENESGQVFPTVKIRNAGQYYWLVAISSGEAPIAYIPVLDKKEIEVPESTAVQRALFKTADVIWFISKFKERLASQDQWFFSTGNSSFFSNLALVLQSEPFELNSIKTDLQDSKANAEILSMNSSIVSMSQKAESLSEKINSVISTEQSFLGEPDTNRLNDLRGSFDDAFSLSSSLNEEIIQYSASVGKLKKIISESSIDSSKKQQLLSFADPPQQLLQVSGKAVVADSVKQAIDSAFSQSITRSKDLIDNLALRIKRNKAALALNAADEDFKAKTENKFSTLEQAATTILSSEYFSLWKNQASLLQFSENYSQAKSLFDKGNYELSLNFSAKAKSNAVVVLRDGFASQAPDTIDWTLWIYFAIALIIIFIIIYFLRNRGKFSALIQQQETGEEVQLHAWERK